MKLSVLESNKENNWECGQKANEGEMKLCFLSLLLNMFFKHVYMHTSKQEKLVCWDW